MSLKKQNADFLRRYVRDRSHNVIDEKGDYRIDAGVAEVRRARGYDDNDDVVEDVRNSPNGTLAMRVIESITVNETSFFRDGHPFDVLVQDILPALIDLNKDTCRLRIWSAASSSGQEAYSLAILIRENFQDLAGWDIEIFASDISQAMVERCTQGVYTEAELSRGMPVDLRDKYMNRVGDDWQMSTHIRNMVKSRVLNLADELEMPPLDLVLLRNVLLYFDLPHKREVLEKVRACMRPWAPLYLGAGETTINVDDGFVPVDFPNFRCFRIDKDRRDS